jgi:hypothetical protein
MRSWCELGANGLLTPYERPTNGLLVCLTFAGASPRNGLKRPQKKIFRRVCGAGIGRLRWSPTISSQETGNCYIAVTLPLLAIVKPHG